MKNDVLLLSARVLLVVGRVILAFGACVLGVGLLFAVFGGAEAFATINAELVETGAPISGRTAMIIVFSLGFAILLLGERFLAQLQAILKTIPAGDPFIVDNAVRLERMGWLALGMQGLGLLTTIYTMEVQELASKLEIDGDFSLEGIFLVLLLFILARVFRHGAAMRADLEGTV